MDSSMLCYPRLEDISSALFIQPHPDDNEIGAGGTMAFLVDKGVPVYGLTVTEGRGGSSVYPPEQLAMIRREEAARAMEILGVENLGCLGYHDGNPIIHERLVQDIVEVIRRLRVNAVFTVDPNLTNEMHPAHLQVGRAVQEAFVRSCNVWYPAADGAKRADAFAPEIIGFYFTDDDNTVADITEYYPLKRQAIMAHHSQVDERIMAGYEEIFHLISNDLGEGKIAERLKLLYRIHTHCMALPVFVRRQLEWKRGDKS